jgi:hypothetical protein
MEHGLVFEPLSSEMIDHEARQIDQPINLVFTVSYLFFVRDGMQSLPLPLIFQLTDFSVAQCGRGLYNRSDLRNAGRA